MGPLQSIKTCLTKSLTFSGRASRSEFWWFAPFGILLPFLVARYMPPALLSWAALFVKVMLIVIAAAPIAAVLARRFQDTNLPGSDAWIALRPVIALVASGWFLLLGVFAIGTIVHAISGVVFFLIAIPVFLINLLFAPGMLGTTIGQLLLPSFPDTNRYGPNPTEVLS
jgi:uncharacterized membrane protein YhaH (DUF805 family)